MKLQLTVILGVRDRGLCRPNVAICKGLLWRDWLISQQHSRPRRRASVQLFDVVISWHHIEVADQRGRYLKIEQFLPGFLEALEPAELTIEFRTSWSAIKRRKTTVRRGSLFAFTALND
ncbi:hypothetical protein [Rhizobium sp.]|uniref:hypothetical protein n=1 Tax=Rhizobium sp. TaxID=391 RepID=UPI003F7F2425